MQVIPDSDPTRISNLALCYKHKGYINKSGHTPLSNLFATLLAESVSRLSFYHRPYNNVSELMPELIDFLSDGFRAEELTQFGEQVNQSLRDGNHINGLTEMPTELFLRQLEARVNVKHPASHGSSPGNGASNSD